MAEQESETTHIGEARRNLDVAEHSDWNGGPDAPVAYAQTALLASIAHSLIVIAEALTTSPVERTD